ncbi:universal stress protein [Sphingomonas abaci]|uniref:Nucleotide-binding universal stress UspA family protein n=1 Tax=Sphingomonas abaci TaxID=237611 RepID=A0A7W7AM59_9SPHN|nr:universal stress protein [Sphingomonas abaci]MBB4619613.1 nucleotide-binding universal stress UspA family protein [Sphingomonas abaci]
MSYKSILVHVGPGPSSGPCLATAEQLARRFEATLIGVAAEAFDPPATGFEDGLLYQTLREQVEADLETAGKRFRDAVDETGLKTKWIAIPGTPDRVIALHARGADLIVASRPKDGFAASLSPRVASLVLDTATPVLVTPSHIHHELKAERIVIGWKDTRESRRAVSDALPFLRKADQVTVAAVCKEGRPDEATGLDEIVGRLSRHGVAVEGRLVPRKAMCVADDLEEVAHEHAADLLVLGAYGHSRLREWALGGVTEDLIDRSSRYILFSH